MTFSSLVAALILVHSKVVILLVLVLNVGMIFIWS